MTAFRWPLLVFVDIFFAKEEVLISGLEKTGVLRVMINVLKMERKAEDIEIWCGVGGERSRSTTAKLFGCALNLLNNNK
jgi:hypothetical protein